MKYHQRLAFSAEAILRGGHPHPQMPRRVILLMLTSKRKTWLEDLLPPDAARKEMIRAYRHGHGGRFCKKEVL